MYEPALSARHSKGISFDVDPRQSSDSLRSTHHVQPATRPAPVAHTNDAADNLDPDEMSEGRRSPYPVKQPLLGANAEESRGRSRDALHPPLLQRPTFNRNSTMRSRSPSRAENALFETKKKYLYAAFFLVASLVSFVIQTETAVYIQRDLGWNKAYCMLYVTHGSWVILWPVQLLILRIHRRSLPWLTFWRRHKYLIRTTAQMVETQSLDLTRGQHSPIPYMLRTVVIVACALTIAGGSWYIAVDMTSPSDLTAIYNCSAFFAYIFAVPLLHEALHWDKSISVLVAVIGVFIVAYGGGDPETPDGTASNRLAGNLIIGVGSVLYGLYEVLYKRLACPPAGTSSGRGMIFANTYGSAIGAFTLLVLWIPLPILHYLGIETFEWPRGETARMLLISICSNAAFSGSFLVLISLTGPVLSSVASLVTIFLVAITDWALTGVPLQKSAITGGGLIIVAFLMLSWSTWREMRGEAQKKQVDMTSDEEDNHAFDA